MLTLIQETVRRLKNSSIDTDQTKRAEILSTFAKKMVNSGHSCEEARRIIVKGVTEYLFLLENSRKPTDSPS